MGEGRMANCQHLCMLNASSSGCIEKVGQATLCFYQPLHNVPSLFQTRCHFSFSNTGAVADSIIVCSHSGFVVEAKASLQSYQLCWTDKRQSGTPTCMQIRRKVTLIDPGLLVFVIPW